MSKKSMLLIFGALAYLTVSGCAPYKVSRGEYGPGKILLLPPRDVVQGGAPHPVGADSGAYFEQAMIRQFANTGYQIILTENPAFNHTTIASREEGIAEAKKAGADYCLQLALGEFRNAAPMSFRTDFVILERGAMWRVSDGQEVWLLLRSRMVDKTNLGNHYPCIEKHAAMLRASIAYKK